MFRIFPWLWHLLNGLWRILVIAAKGTPAQSDELLDMRRIIAGMFPIVLIGFGLNMVVCGRFWAEGAMWCLSCISVGSAVGFLFGIPKVLQGHARRNSEASSVESAYLQRVNTNLEEISDWLTKIVVGLGLVQLAKIPGWINKIATLFTASIQQSESQTSVFAAVIVFFLVAGFLFGYLITRLFLQGALGRADRAAALPEEPKRTVSSEGGSGPAEIGSSVEERTAIQEPPETPDRSNVAVNIAE